MLGGIEKHIMKKNRKWKIAVSIIAALVLLFATTIAVAYTRYLHPTGSVMPGIYAIRTHRNGMIMGNFFLMQAGDQYIAIDAGADNTETVNGLRQLGIAANDVVAVFITHAHWDHIGSLDLFNNAVIYAGNIRSGEYPDTPHQMLEDGETIEIFDKTIQILHTPGHTADSVCYLINGKYLFVGDLLITTNEPPPPNPKRHNVEWQLMYRERVLGLDGVEFVFSGHFGLFKDVRFFRWWWL